MLPTNYTVPPVSKAVAWLISPPSVNPSLLKEYDTIIRNQVQQGIVQPVEDPELTEADNVHYLPHHAVSGRTKKSLNLESRMIPQRSPLVPRSTTACTLD